MTDPDVRLTGETTGAGRAAALRELEAVSRIQARTGVAVKLPTTRAISGSRRAHAIERMEAFSRIAARTKAAKTATTARPALTALSALTALQEALQAGNTYADDEQRQALDDATYVVAALALVEASDADPKAFEEALRNLGRT